MICNEVLSFWIAKIRSCLIGCSSCLHVTCDSLPFLCTHNHALCDRLSFVWTNQHVMYVWLSNLCTHNNVICDWLSNLCTHNHGVCDWLSNLCTHNHAISDWLSNLCTHNPVICDWLSTLCTQSRHAWLAVNFAYKHFPSVWSDVPLAPSLAILVTFNQRKLKNSCNINNWHKTRSHSPDPVGEMLYHKSGHNDSCG